MNEATRRKIAADFYEDSDVEETLGGLACRWLDEKDYEDINDYQGVMEKVANKHKVKITAMKKRPFGCLFVVEGAEEIVYQLSIKVSSGSYEYKRIK